jgi:hypothetical protein
MSVKALIGDGEGSGFVAGVTSSNALKVLALPTTARGVPPADLSNLRLLREYLEFAGSPNMNIDGSVTNQIFQVEAAAGITKWIRGIRILLEGTNFELTGGSGDFRRFGAIAAGLANGFLLDTVQSGITTLVTTDPIRTTGDFFNYSDGYTNFINAISATSDFLAIDFFFDQPVVLTEGSSDSVRITIRDNLTAIGSFRAIARGYQEFL